MLLPQDVIRKKRDGLALTASEIRFFVDGATSGTVSEGQIGAFTMAVYLRGMTIEEIADFTLAMRDSGRVLDWNGAAVDPTRLIDRDETVWALGCRLRNEAVDSAMKQCGVRE